MDNPLSSRLRNQVDGPRDGALLRFSLGNALLAEGDALAAATEFRAAISFDTQFSAAWKMLGTALADSDQVNAANEAWEQGIVVASQRGDIQAAREMHVFQRRLRKQQES